MFLRHLKFVFETFLNALTKYFTIFKFTNDTYPVIVWIHGGGFQSGSSSDYPQEAILNNFVSRKTIFVSMNYRLGPLGRRKFSY